MLTQLQEKQLYGQDRYDSLPQDGVKFVAVVGSFANSAR